MGEGTLGELIRPAGYFRDKARKLKAFLAHLNGRYGGRPEAMLSRPLEPLRGERICRICPAGLIF